MNEFGARLIRAENVSRLTRTSPKFRAEAFNMANHVNLGLADDSFGAGPDGKDSRATFAHSEPRPGHDVAQGTDRSSCAVAIGRPVSLRMGCLCRPW